VSGIFLPLRVNSLPLATIYEVKIPLRKWKKSLLQRNSAQMTWANVILPPILTENVVLLSFIQLACSSTRRILVFTGIHLHVLAI
jgi:hypothetical protein